MNIEIQDVTVTGTQTFDLIGGREYFLTVGGPGTAYVKFWDGTTWKTYEESDGTASQGFRAWTPRSGKIQVVATGSVVINAIPV